MELMTDQMRVLCAGDLFISPGTLAAAARRRIGEAVPGVRLDVVEHTSTFPDDPFRSVDGVHEAAGDPAEVAALAPGVHVLLTHHAPITEDVLAAAGPGLHLVGVARGGPVNVDVAAATALGVPVTYLPGRNLSAVAEFVVGSMVAAMRSIGPASTSMAAGAWDGSFYRYDRCGPELGASTVGLVGLGAIGARVATLLAAFGTRVVAYDPFATPEAASEASVELVDLAHLLAESDVVSVHARSTAQTRGMFDAARFAAMRPGAYFINTARGDLVDTDALTAALVSGHIRGAVIDVFDPEPPPADHPLRRMASVQVTPHIAGASRQTAEVSADRLAAAAAGYLATGRLDHCANPETLVSPVHVAG